MKNERPVMNSSGQVVGYICELESRGYWAYRLWDHQSKIVPLGYLARNFCLEK